MAAATLHPPQPAATHSEEQAVADTLSPATPQQPKQPQQQPCFVIVHNVAKKHNVGTISRCATAFGVKELCLVGSRHYNTFGSHGADAHVDMRHYPTLPACVAHLKQAHRCEVIGVEIGVNALPIQSHPFTGPTAFMLGNEGQGLSDKQLALCDKLVYIPQYGAGTASLNVAVAASIVLHHYALWAGYSERARHGAKFIVAERPQRVLARGCVGDPEAIRAQRQARPPQEEADTDEQAAGAALADMLA